MNGFGNLGQIKDYFVKDKLLLLMTVYYKKINLTWFQKSTLTENWGSVRSSTNDSSMKYIVHKQPLSLDRFFIHDVTPQEAIGAKLEHAFILICLNRFQQIVQVHTFQTETEALKVSSKTIIKKRAVEYNQKVAI